MQPVGQTVCEFGSLAAVLPFNRDDPDHGVSLAKWMPDTPVA
jgi:hypothetical protein